MRGRMKTEREVFRSTYRAYFIQIKSYFRVDIWFSFFVFFEWSASVVCVKVFDRNVVFVFSSLSSCLSSSDETHQHKYTRTQALTHAHRSSCKVFSHFILCFRFFPSASYLHQKIHVLHISHVCWILFYLFAFFFLIEKYEIFVFFFLSLSSSITLSISSRMKMQHRLHLYTFRAQLSSYLE